MAQAAEKRLHHMDSGGVIRPETRSREFDAGGPCAAGVPAVMYGVGGGGSVLDVDFVPISHAQNVTRVITHALLTFLT